MEDMKCHYRLQGHESIRDTERPDKSAPVTLNKCGETPPVLPFVSTMVSMSVDPVEWCQPARHHS